jgi:hypothetical protein
MHILLVKSFGVHIREREREREMIMQLCFILTIMALGLQSYYWQSDSHGNDVGL